MDLKELVSAQRRYWNSGATRSVGFRRDMLEKLERAVVSRERELLSALRKDLGKAPYESYACEVGMTLAELRCAKSHLARWTAPKGRPSPMALFPAKSRVVADPYGVALIMSPWNYPVQLTLVPLISALAAGNCAVVKPSAYAPACSSVLKALISDIFPREYAAVVEGGRAENSALLEERFDYIFFTGSTEVGRTVMRAAAEFLTPVTLELGGKSPVIIGEDADLKLAARRLAWGKFLNAGQTCVAPDHVWVPEGMRDALVEELGKQIRALYGENPLESPDLPKIVNKKHFNRINGLIQREKTAIGGKSDPVTRRIEPTVLVDVTETDAVMGEEIFGPVLPILTYTDLEELLARQQQKPRPLALYLFTRDRRAEERILRMVPSGGVCVNDTVVHLANPNVPFGGVGASGMGACHGKAGFDTFTHFRTVVRRGALDLPVRYPPYGGKGLGLLRKLM